VENGPLQDALEPQCRLCLPGILFRKFWRGLLKKVTDLLLELFQVASAGALPSKA